MDMSLRVGLDGNSLILSNGSLSSSPSSTLIVPQLIDCGTLPKGHKNKSPCLRPEETLKKLSVKRKTHKINVSHSVVFQDQIQGLEGTVPYS